MRKKGKRIRSPRRLLREVTEIILYALLTGWNIKSFLKWATQLENLFHAGTGAKQICCFGPNPHIVWEMTGMCNLKCIHCHAFGGTVSYDELSKEEGKVLLDQIASLDIKTFVFTGGEPFLREDLMELIAYAKSKGFNIFVATNGTLITKDTAKLLKKYNVGVVIGLDGINPDIHDSIRGVKGSFNEVIRGIENSLAERLYLHLNIVATKLNYHEIERIIDYGNEIGVYSYFIYNFVPFGRGENIQKYKLDKNEFILLLDTILRKQRESKSIIIPVASPEYWAYILQRRGIHNRRLINFFGKFLGGCLSGKGMLYIKPNGDVWPCPFSTLVLGNVKRERIDRIWANLGTVNYSRKETECDFCEYKPVCGGCKTRIHQMGCPLK